MKRITLQKIVLSGLFAATVFVATALFPFPLPGGGYANLGDCFVLTAGLLLGPVYGGLAAAVGSLLADLFAGFGIYAPATFVIKGVMALIFALFIGKKSSKVGILRLSLAAVCAEVIMILGYFLFESVLYGIGGAAVNIVGNSAQGLVGAASAIILSEVLFKTKATQKIGKLH